MPSFDPLLEYAKYISNTALLYFRPPKNCIFENTSGMNNKKVSSVIIDRQGQFQTELFIFAKDIKDVEMHTHPGVDSIECAIGGDFILEADGKKYKGQSTGEPLGLGPLVRIPEDMVHGAELFCGASFLSFQHWKKDPPSSIGDSFVIKE